VVDRRSQDDVGEPLRRVLQVAATTTVGAAAAPARCDAGAAADQMVGRLLVGCAWIALSKETVGAGGAARSPGGRWKTMC